MSTSETQRSKKIAIVTGGAAGLGYSITQKLLANGIHTVIIDRDTASMAKAQEELGGEVTCIEGDLAKLDSIPGLISDIKERFGRIDILVNNAGIHLKKPMLEVTDEEYQRVILINQTAVFCLSREVGKVMVEQGEGAILNISSMASQYGIPYVIAYTAAKSAIEGMTRAMAVELSPKGVRINCIAPGFIKTNMSSKALNSDPERKQRVLSRTPMAKLGLPEDVANSAYFMVSDEAKYLTGVVLPVDGGNSIGF